VVEWFFGVRRVVDTRVPFRTLEFAFLNDWLKFSEKSEICAMKSSNCKRTREQKLSSEVRVAQDSNYCNAWFVENIDAVTFPSAHVAARMLHITLRLSALRAQHALNRCKQFARLALENCKCASPKAQTAVLKQAVCNA
jgi:hypothetical protein